jgi:hypothetical protein
MECKFAPHNHSGSGILKQHFLQIDREDNQPLTKTIYSGSSIQALVNQTEPADFVRPMLKHFKLLVTEHGTTKPEHNVPQKQKQTSQSFEYSYSYGRVLDTFEDH